MLRSQDFWVGVVIGVVGVWAYHKYGRAMGTTPKAAARSGTSAA